MLQVETANTQQQVFELQDSDVGKKLAHADSSRKVQPHDVGRFVTVNNDIWDYFPVSVTRKDFYAH